MINCESCIKSDVCGKKESSNKAMKDLQLSKVYQELNNAGINFNVECGNFMKVNTTRVLGGNYEQ